MNTFRTISGNTIFWRDKKDVVHRCEGADVHRGVRLLWTLCKRDVPANAAYTTDGPEFVTCQACSATASSPLHSTSPERSAARSEHQSALKACPFCGSGEVELHPNDLAKSGGPFHGQYATQDGAQVQYAHCNGCGAEGPQAFIIDEVVTAWNRRAEHQSDSAGAGDIGTRAGRVHDALARAKKKPKRRSLPSPE